MLPKASVAVSGVRKLGMPAMFNALRALRTSSSPIQQASTGLPARRKTSVTALATASESLPGLGEYTTSTPSTLASLPQASTAAR